MIISPTLGDVITVLFKRRGVFALTFLTVAGLGGAYLYIATPRYLSEASVIVRFDGRSVSDTDMAHDSTPVVVAQNDRREIMQSHADILGSKDLAASVIDALGGVGAIYPKIAANPPEKGTMMDAAVKEFDKRIGVKLEPQGNVLSVSFLHPDPVMAQRALRQSLNEYMRREGETFSGSSIEFERQQVDAAAARLAAAQKELREYKATSGIASFDDQITGLIRQRSTADTNLKAAQVALAQSEQRRDELRRQLKTVAPSIASSASEKYRSLDDAQSKLADLRGKEQQMLSTYKTTSPLLNQLRASIQVGQADVDSRRGDVSRRDASAPNVVYQNIQTDLLRAIADATSNGDSVTVLTKQVADIDHDLNILEAQRMGLNDRARAVDIQESTYRTLSMHLEDQRVATNRVQERISHGAVIALPTLPYTVSSPRYILFGPAFVVAGLLLGCLMALLIERIDDRFTSVGQIEPVLRVPVLASFRQMITQ